MNPVKPLISANWINLEYSITKVIRILVTGGLIG